MHDLTTTLTFFRLHTMDLLHISIGFPLHRIGVIPCFDFWSFFFVLGF